MTSQINPNNIDGTYPVAGVSNNTQGMRDNFTNTRTNFQYARDEINELQQKAVLKSAVTGTTLDNNMNDNLIYAVRLQDVSYTLINVAATSGTVTLDYAAGQYQQINTTGSISLAFVNWPVSGTIGSIQIGINITDPAFTVTLPAAVSQGLIGLEGISPGTPGVSNTITFNQIGNFVFEFVTPDAGTTVYIFDQSRPRVLYTAAVAIEDETPSTSTATGALTVDGGVGIAGDLYVGGDIVGNIVVTGISLTGNVTGGNLITPGVVTAAGTVTAGNLITAGGVTATGNVVGAGLRGQTLSLTGNIISAATVTGNVTGGNLRTEGLVSAAGNITGANIRTTGTVSTTGTVINAGISTSGNVTAAAVITGMLDVDGVANLQDTTITGNLVPTVDNAYTLGNVSNKWANVYIGPSSIHIEDTANASNVAVLQVTNGSLLINGVQGLQANLINGSTSLDLYASGDIRANVAGIANVMTINSQGVATANLRATGGVTSNSAIAGIGYTVGAGGTVTQLTSKSTAVTLNTITGQITMNSALLGGDVTVSFTLNNSAIANTDVIILNQVGGGNVGEYAFNGVCNTGSAQISVHNMTNTNRSDAIVLRFAVIKAATS